MHGINLTQGNPTECLIHFGQGHDARFADLVLSLITENGIGIMDRGFAGGDLYQFVELELHIPRADPLSPPY